MERLVAVQPHQLFSSDAALPLKLPLVLDLGVPCCGREVPQEVFVFLNSGSMMILLLNVCLLSMMPEAGTGSALTPLCSQTTRGVLCLEKMSPFKKTQKVDWSEIVKRVRKEGQRAMLGPGKHLARNLSAIVAVMVQFLS